MWTRLSLIFWPATLLMLLVTTLALVTMTPPLILVRFLFYHWLTNWAGNMVSFEGDEICQCTDWHGCIMKSSLSGEDGIQPFKFSECSLSQFQRWMEQGSALCLLNRWHNLTMQNYLWTRVRLDYVTIQNRILKLVQLESLQVQVFRV